MAGDHAIEQMLELIGGVRAAGMANDDLHDLGGKVQLAGQRALAQGHMEQRPHLPDHQRAQGALQGDPEATGMPGRFHLAGAIPPGEEASRTSFQGQFVLIPPEQHIAGLHRQPDPLLVFPKGINPFFQHKAAGGVNPGAAGQGKTPRLVEALHRQGSQFVGDVLQ